MGGMPGSHSEAILEGVAAGVIDGPSLVHARRIAPITIPVITSGRRIVFSMKAIVLEVSCAIVC